MSNGQQQLTPLDSTHCQNQHTSSRIIIPEDSASAMADKDPEDSDVIVEIDLSSTDDGDDNTVGTVGCGDDDGAGGCDSDSDRHLSPTSFQTVKEWLDAYEAAMSRPLKRRRMKSSDSWDGEWQSPDRGAGPQTPSMTPPGSPGSRLSSSSSVLSGASLGEHVSPISSPSLPVPSEVPSPCPSPSPPAPSTPLVEVEVEVETKHCDCCEVVGFCRICLREFRSPRPSASHLDDVFCPAHNPSPTSPRRNKQ